MRRPPKPTFDYQRKPALWAAAATIGLSFVAIFIVERPAWVLPVAFVAGCIAAGTGGYYDAPANNGFAGVAVAAVPVYGLFVLTRVLLLSEPITDPDTIFLAGTLAMVDSIMYVPFMMTFAYLGGVVGDAVRRCVRKPIGY